MPEESLADQDVELSGDLRAWVTVFLKGMAMGFADTLPGVSGGTIALITGIYERLITALSSLDPSVLRAVPRLHTRDGWTTLGHDLVAMDVPFLLVLGAGIATAVVTVSRVVHFALVDFPSPTFAFFFGLIAASAVVLYREVHVRTAGQVAAGVVGFGLAFLLSDPQLTGTLPHTPPVVFLVGTVTITATILPGVSGAFLLLLFGQYEFLSGTLTQFVDLLVATPTGGDPSRLLGPGTVVVSFCLGALVGVLSVSRVIRWALDTYRTATLTFLVSLMVGALRTPTEHVLAETSAWTPASGATVLAAALAGGATVLALDYYTDDLTY
ncbi:MAG: DUF368 domain-containing protein [Haloarculaceae archaeon]